MSETDWRCERCGANGRIEYVTDASVYDVVEQLRAAHDDKGGAECQTDLSRIRVWRPVTASLLVPGL